jgi:hypothetical protein cdiviTM7_01565|uniref:Small hydrophilic plant seed protein n=2 Tax=unclassified Caudoviricetes TaxID=2788787 RepID=A0A8S5Q7R3_9CAUD|nr:MAG TPA: Small hydrophilic plant seed protein [Siphoviridae sp. cta8k49]DAE14819.1 MAG TPA: Small hydrophilic plant seed protein [Siphoviridae sp. ctM0g22]DAK14114.1 MAG TPA: Small hydrophilic plant seed protein [Caudoviricetes sp.]DAS55097.1 MAG TPA: Small hydrophilic plant seed protein [Caudoviricetes sp.]
MTETKSGGRKTAATILAKNPNFYREIGRKGGSVGGKKGFALNPELARICGAKGGRISKRRSKQDIELAEFEKTAPYGRCSMCNLALIKSDAERNDYPDMHENCMYERFGD